MTDSNFIKIFTGNLIITERIKQSLKELDINAVIREQNESGLDPKIYGGHLLQIIYVHKDQLAQSVEVVESITADLET